MVKPEDEKQFKDWLKNNKGKFVLDSDNTRELGILTDFHNQYDNFSEIRIDEVIYSDNDEGYLDVDEQLNAQKELSHQILEYDEFLEKLDKKLLKYQQSGYSENFINYYKEIELFKFDMYTDSRKEWEEIEILFIQIFEKKKQIEKTDTQAYSHLLLLEKKFKYIQKELKSRKKD